MEASKKLENILQSMGDAFVSLDRSWTYTFVNDKALTLMGKTSEQLIGKTLWQVFPDTVGTVFDTAYHKVMDQRETEVFETYYPSYDMWLEVRAYPHDEGIAIFYTDISLRKKNEERMADFNRELEAMVAVRTRELETANKEMESFSYSVSHDLRAPLRAIHGYMDIFMEEYGAQLDDEAKRLTGIVQQNANRMGRLIDELLSFSRLGKHELRKTELPMKTLVEEAWSSLAKDERAAAVEFVLADLPAAHADYTTIRQVWTNLLSNALKYSSHAADPRIEAGLEIKEGETIYYVRDNGVGFDMAYYNKLFGVFQRLHSQEEFEGTGVGLAIVQRIIHRHGGRVWAEAKPGQGATFYFTLPG